jgi:hypothetical protein
VGDPRWRVRSVRPRAPPNHPERLATPARARRREATCRIFRRCGRSSFSPGMSRLHRRAAPGSRGAWLNPSPLPQVGRGKRESGECGREDLNFHTVAGYQHLNPIRP